MELILIIICIIGPMVFALLGKTHPELISRNRNGQPMDEDGKRFFFRACFIMSSMFLSALIVTSIPALEKIKDVISVCIVMFATALLFFFLWKYVIRKRNSVIQTVLCFLAILLFAGMAVVYCFVSQDETEVIVNESTIEIEGPNATTISMSEIQSLKVVKALPETENDSCLILVESSHSPFVEVRTAGKTYYLNKYSSEKTMELILALENIAEDKFINAE
ncbi:MAG: hypothetical protein MJZ91_01530 [Bacteroidales bacterium]|nr:hypothetical protein [Bacteroidales bacterium]